LAALAVAHGFDGWLINIENRMGGRELRHLQVGCVLSGDGGGLFMAGCFLDFTLALHAYVGLRWVNGVNAAAIASLTLLPMLSMR
jgi:hypothetical protein